MCKNVAIMPMKKSVDTGKFDKTFLNFYLVNACR